MHSNGVNSSGGFSERILCILGPGEDVVPTVLVVMTVRSQASPGVLDLALSHWPEGDSRRL